MNYPTCCYTHRSGFVPDKGKWASVYILLCIAAVALSCRNQAETSMVAEATEMPAQEENLISVTRAQFETNGMQLGKATFSHFPDAIRTAGYIDVPPQAKVDISVYYGGYVKSLNLLPGQWVKKGEQLFSLENPDFVQMQQDYLETKAQLVFLESDYQRQRTLAGENISSQKSFLKAETEYQVHQVRLEGMKKKLQMLGIKPEGLQPGELASSVPVYAPISGYITKVNTSSGSFLNTSAIAVEIINTEHLHVELEVFEKDISRLHKDQVIEFWLPAEAGKRYLAAVHLIGSLVEGENRVVRVHGHLADEKAAHGLIPGMYVEALIETVQDSALALPEEAIVSMEDASYVLLQQQTTEDGFTFEKQQVQPGRIRNGMVEIKDAAGWSQPVLLKGAFNLIVEE